MPAETAPTDERFARALAWERRAHEQAAAWIEALGYGQAYLNERVPHVHWANMLWVTARDGVDGAELVADADRILSDFAHRQLVVEHEALWRTLEAEMAAAGWEREALVYMSHERPPDRMPDLAAVREVGHDDIAAAEDRCMQGEHETATAEARRQVLAHNRHIGELLGERCFAAHDGADVRAYAKLRHRDAVAQVEDVAVLPEHRGAGLGRLVTCAALAAGLALEPELLFIVADDEDWPKELYGRLGFVPMGRTRGYLRPPPSGARAAAPG